MKIPFRGLFRHSESGGQEIKQLTEGSFAGSDSETLAEKPPVKTLTPTGIEVAVVYGTNRDQAETTQIRFKELEDISEFADLTMLDEEHEKPVREWIPSVAISKDSPPDETIWLTRQAAEERLNVLLHTHREFNESPSVAETRAFADSGLSDRSRLGADLLVQTNTRRGVPVQKMIETFEKAGYHFVRNAQGEVLILVDATIPANQNTNGRYAERHLGEFISEDDRHSVAGTALLGQDKDKIGVRPVQEDSAHAIAIPVKKLIEMHLQPGIIQEDHFYRDQATRDLPIRGDTDVSPNEAVINRQVWDCLTCLTQGAAKDSELLQRLNAVTEVPDHPGRDLEIKQQLFDLLAEFGFQARIAKDGYFPYEPVYQFWNQQIQAQPQQTRENLLQWNQSPKSHYPPPSRLFLEDMVNMVKQALYKD